MRTGSRRSGRRRRCLRAGRASAPRSSPRSRGARSAEPQRPTFITCAGGRPGTARTTSGRCAAGATDTSQRSRPGGCPRRDRRSLRGSRLRADPLIERSGRVGEKSQTWVSESAAGRYPLQATTLRGTPHPPLAARPPALAAVRCQAGRGRVHGCAGGPRRPDLPAALLGPAPRPPWGGAAG